MRGRFLRLGSLLLCLGPTLATRAQSEDFSKTELTQERFVAQSLDALCNDVNNQTILHDDPANYTYRYEKSIYRAAKIDFATDDQSSGREKVSRLWETYPAYFHCDTSNFSVPAGAIEKYAIETRTFSFVEDLAFSWHVGLNRIDPADCRTLLDFVDHKLAQNVGTHLEPTLAGYRDRLRLAGGKRADEISSSERHLQAEAWTRSVARMSAAGVRLNISSLKWPCFD